MFNYKTGNRIPRTKIAYAFFDRSTNVLFISYTVLFVVSVIHPLLTALCLLRDQYLSAPYDFRDVTMYNVRNIRISDGCVYAQIRKGLGMHLVTYTNRDTVPFLLLVQYKGGLSEIELIVSLFSNACMILLPFLKILEILCTSLYIKGGIAHSC